MTEKVKVLVVEDEFIVAEDIRINLEKAGYEVTDVARNGDDGVKAFKKNSPDVVLLDIRLGEGMDGIATAGIIRNISDVPLIYITAHSDKATFDKAKPTQPHAYIVKPFNFHNLHSAIELALSNYSRKLFGTLHELSDKPAEISNDQNYVFNDAVFVRFGKAFQKIRFTDICFIKADGSYSILHTRKRDFTLSMNLHTIMERLGRPEFLRVHRSYVVNLDCIDRIEEGAIQVNDQFIPVSKSSREALLRKLNSL
jgi:DNA-binding LytR/AlgR family response regulator